MSKKPFNSGFEGLSKIKIEEKKVPAPAPPPRPAASASPSSDEDAFLKAMHGVKQLNPDARGERQVPVVAKQSDDDALIDLASSLDPEVELVSEDPLRHAAAKSLDRKILKKLRAGEIAVESELDLHGKRRDQAEAALDRFIRESLSQKMRCVLVITGRGNNSEDGAVLKPAIADALRKGRLVKHVLAYTEANPGSYYVLLRRR